MELFTLGADRGAYTETDVRELARALTGWRADWNPITGWSGFRWDRSWWDPGAKTVFGRSGAWTWQDACRLVVEHPLHASFFVAKLWSAFVPVAPAPETAAALERLYVESGHQIRPVVEAILCSRELYEGPAMVKPPVVLLAGMLRATGQGVTESAYEWAAFTAGQRLFYPPDVSGWDEATWLDTSTMRGRWDLVNWVAGPKSLTWPAWDAFPRQTAAQAVAAARVFWNDPPLTAETVEFLTTWAAGAIPSGSQPGLHAQRQNALRMLIGVSPDHQTS